MLSVEISCSHDDWVTEGKRLRQAVEMILRDADYEDGVVGIALVDDDTIHELNRKFLAHDCPTDVLSFALERSPRRLEGEVIASIDTATRVAANAGWKPQDELLLYVIHGTLHLVGYDDTTDVSRTEMRAAEHRYLGRFGLALKEVPHAGAPAET